jgi:HAE1 family hydrophobic/amphiphilic exporter-1
VTIPFGLLSLVLFRTPMDIYAMFGLFMLVGIVKKNGILQVDSTNQLRAQGLTGTTRSSRPTTPGCGRS